MDTKRVCEVCCGRGGERLRAFPDVIETCRSCSGDGFTTTTSTLTREERRFELIKAALTGILASESAEYGYGADDKLTEAAISQADAVLARLAAEIEQPEKDQGQ